jgi:hypothetical protein
LFTAAAALSLGLGIGANSAVFSLFNALLWQPMPVHDPDGLVRIYSRVPGRPDPGYLSYPEATEYARQQVADDLAIYRNLPVALGHGGQATISVFMEAVSGNYFRMLRPRMALGRGIRPEEAAGGGRGPRDRPVAGAFRRRPRDSGSRDPDQRRHLHGCRGRQPRVSRRLRQLPGRRSLGAHHRPSSPGHGPPPR